MELQSHERSTTRRISGRPSAPVDSFPDDKVPALESIDGVRRAEVCEHGGGVRTTTPPGDHDVDTELDAKMTMTYMADEFPTLWPKEKPRFDMSGEKNGGDFTVSSYI